MAGENKRIGQFYTRTGDRGTPPNAPGQKKLPPRRGMLGQIMNAPMEKYLELHPEMACRWEHMPRDDAMSLVPFREAQGYHIVDAAELGPTTQSAQKTGPIRKGDLVLMACPKETQDAIDTQDYEAADNDFKTPERTYKEAMEQKSYETKSGEVLRAPAFGKITRSNEEGSPEQFGESPPTE